MEAGISSDLHPSLLPKNVAAWAINSTMRGGFPRPRPPLYKRELNFQSNLDVQTAVEKGFFQGAGYYRPDFGSPQLVAQIGGRLFTFTPGAGVAWDVAEITIPGDPNDATTNQVWMNQAEKWLIITDGTAKLPIFWDGVTARRSYGPSVLLGTATVFNPAAPPDIGDQVEVTLTAPYTGEFNIPVLFNGFYYETKSTTSSQNFYEALLTNINDASATLAVGTPITAAGLSAVANVANQITPPQTLGMPFPQFPPNSGPNLFIAFWGFAMYANALPENPPSTWEAFSGPQTGSLIAQPLSAHQIDVGVEFTITTQSPLTGLEVGATVLVAASQTVVTRVNSKLPNQTTYSPTPPNFPNYPDLNPVTTTNALNIQCTIVSITGDQVLLRTTARAVGVGEWSWPGATVNPGDSVRRTTNASAEPVSVIYSGPAIAVAPRSVTATEIVITAGAPLQFVSGAPTPTVAEIAVAFTVPAQGTSAIATIDRAYTGPENQTVSISGKQYRISASPPPAPTTTLFLINLTDTTSAIAYTNPTDIFSVPELPAGRMGAYGLGHQAMSLVDGISFIYGDAVGGPAGTQASDYRDAVLKTNENTFLIGGGSFRIPNSGEIITSMTFAAVLDAAYGQGPLLLGTPTSIFTCAVPTDRSEWIALTNPILTQALIGKGPLGQNSTIAVNSDTLFRTSEGWASLIFGRRDFETWGNVSQSAEMDRTVSLDIRSLLSYSSAVTFDNRFLCTAAPQVSAQGVYHIGTLALNFDPVSSLRGKAPSIWESLWTGTNVLQYIVGTFNSTERCFQFTFNERDNKIELWEQLRSDVPNEYFDNGDTRIQWTVETPCIFKPEDRAPQIPIVRLNNGKIHLRDIVGTVRVKVQYRPDFWPCWVDWHEFDVCATVDAENEDSHPGYKTPVGLGTPSSEPCEAGNNRVMRSGRFFQLRLVFTGQCVFMGGEFEAVPEPTIGFPPPPCNIASE